ncbi:hypothetical protein F1C76_21700 [Geodermatophilaceae bacterium NBWT11]|nr:hypothetical protein F1C76_21700 [Geodermatophilaceae bacterium NBWT11]
MTTPVQTTGAAPKGSPQLLVLLIMALAPAMVLGTLTGAGPAALIGAFVALFGLLICATGPLWSDLRSMALFAPLLVVAAVAPRALAEVSRPAAIAVIVVLVVVAALLPLRGPRFRTAGLGVGMLPLMAYSIPLTGAVTLTQLVIGALAGLVVAVVLRLLMGIGDPGKATRTAVAAVLDDSEPDVTAALDSWLADPRRWTMDVLGGAVRYRLARRSLDALAGTVPAAGRAAFDRAGTDLTERVGRLSEAVRAKEPATGGADVPSASSSDEYALPQALSRLVEECRAALDTAEAATRGRDDTRVELSDEVTRGARAQIALGAGVGFRSIQLRHAARTAVGVLLALLLSTRLDAGDPLVPTLLLTTFGILQTSWTATLAKARPRITGLVVGVVLAVGIVFLVPEGVLLPVALVSLVVALWYLTARPVIGYAGLLCMSVGLNSSLRDLDPAATLVEYVVLSLIAVLIGVVLGFAVIPGVRGRPLSERVSDAVAATAAVLSTSVEGNSSDRERGLEVQRTAVLTRRQLVPDDDDLTDAQAAELDALGAGLRDLTALTLLGRVGVAGRVVDRRDVDGALAALGHGGPVDHEPEVSPSPTGAGPGVLTVLAEQVAARRAALDRPGGAA